MRIQLFSDLHLEFYPTAMRSLADIEVDASADVVVLAGDIAKGWASVEFAQEVAQRAGAPVLWIPGNHEYYGRDFDELNAQFEQAQLEGVHVLMNRDVTLQGVRFLGATLWTDFALYEGARRLRTREDALTIGQIALNDFRVIRRGRGLFSARASAEEHACSRAFLEQELARKLAGPTVVITHHAPHPRSIHPRFAADSRVLKSNHRLPHERDSWRINPCFASNLEGLLQGADLWLHGHMHDSVDYQVGGCRVVANPRGYPAWALDQAPRFENGAFNPRLLLEV